MSSQGIRMSVCLVSGSRVTWVSRAWADSVRDWSFENDDVRTDDGRIRDVDRAENAALIFHESDHEYRIRTTPVGQILHVNGELCNVLFMHFALCSYIGVDLDQFGLEVLENQSGESLLGDSLIKEIRTIDDLREAIFSLSEFEQYLLHGAKHLFSDDSGIDRRISAVEKGCGLVRSFLNPEIPFEPIPLRKESYEVEYFDHLRRNLQHSQVSNPEFLIRSAAGGVTPPFEFLADLTAKICAGFQPNRSASQRYGMSLEQERELIFSGKYFEFLDSIREKMENPNEDSYASEMHGPYMMFQGMAIVDSYWRDLDPPEPETVDVEAFAEWNSYSIPQIAAIYRALYPDTYSSGRLSLKNLQYVEDLDPMFRWHKSLDRLEFVPKSYSSLMLRNSDPIADPDRLVEALDECDNDQLRCLPLEKVSQVVSKENVDFIKSLFARETVWAEDDWLQKVRSEVAGVPISILCRKRLDITVPRRTCKFDLDLDEMIETTLEWNVLQLRRAAVRAGLAQNPTKPLKIDLSFKGMPLPADFKSSVENSLAEYFARLVGGSPPKETA